MDKVIEIFVKKFLVLAFLPFSFPLERFIRKIEKRKNSSSNKNLSKGIRFDECIITLPNLADWKSRNEDFHHSSRQFTVPSIASQSIIFVIHGELTIRLFEAYVCARSVYLTRFKHETLETRLLIGSAYQRPFLLTLSFLLSSLRSNGELELSFLTD